MCPSIEYISILCCLVPSRNLRLLDPLTPMNKNPQFLSLIDKNIFGKLLRQIRISVIKFVIKVLKNVVLKFEGE